MTLLLLAGCAAPEVIRGVVYDDRFGKETSLDVYLPDGGDSRAAVMLIHGGGWRFGSRDMYERTADRLARSGFVAVPIDYRLGAAGRWPAGAQDCVCALSFLRAHAADYGIDPLRIAVTGYSAGGHLSALLGVAADDPVIAPDCEWGPTDLPAAAIPGDGPYDLRGRDRDLIRDFLGGTEEEMPEAYADASPLTHVAPGKPPFLFVHATGDLVDVEMAREMRSALANAGNDARLLEIAGGGHVTNPGADVGRLYVQAAEDQPEAWLATVDFLDETLGAP